MHPSKILTIWCIGFLVSVALISFLFPEKVLPATPYSGIKIKEDAKILNISKEDNKKTLILNIEGTDKNVRATLFTDKSFNTEEGVTVSGSLKEPENFNNFPWRGYLAKDGIAYLMDGARIQKKGEYTENLNSHFAGLNNSLKEGVDNTLLPPHSSLYKAMVLGDKEGFSSTQRDIFANAGLSHIIAISGMHITIITILLVYAGVYAGLNRYHSRYIALLILAVYIFLIGAPASAVRAGIMAGVVILAESFGRPRGRWRALLYAATAMVVVNPLILRYDVGFQLSFLAVSGILIFHERLQALFSLAAHRLHNVLRGIKKEYKYSQNKLQDLLSITFSAQIFTAPLAWYYFGTFSFTAPLTNILIIPILPIALISGVVAAAAGATLGIAGSFVAAPAWMFSEYIWTVASVFS